MDRSRWARNGGYGKPLDEANTGRPTVAQVRCRQHVTPCSPESVQSGDRRVPVRQGPHSLGFAGDTVADGYSGRAGWWPRPRRRVLVDLFVPT